MNVYDTANRLASEIKSSEEYKQYKEAKQKIDNNPDLKQKIDEFEKLRYDVQVLAIQGKEAGEEKNKKLQEMYTMLIGEKEIKEYFDLEVKFKVMIADVNKIIAESVQDVLLYMSKKVTKSKVVAFFILIVGASRARMRGKYALLLYIGALIVFGDP